MKKLLINSGILFSLLGITMAVFWNLQGYSSSDLASLLDKHNRLDSLDALGKPKIIIVGGSNCPYGFNSRLLEDSLHLPVANLGLHAGFGLRFILNDCAEFVRKGDIVVLSPEYMEFLDKEFNGESALNELIIGIYPGGIKKLAPGQAGRFLSNMGQYMEDLISRPIRTGAATLSGVNNTEARKLKAYVYSRSAFNAWGDYAIPGDFHLSVRPGPEQIGGALNLDCLTFVRKFKAYVEAKGATLVITPQSLQRSSYDLSVSKIKEIDSCMKAMGMPFNSDCEKYALPDKYFFNTINHLDSAGQTIRTALVADELEKIIRRSRS